MAGETMIEYRQYPDIFGEQTFGPFTSASADQFLPFLSVQDRIIDDIHYSYTVAGGSGATFQIFRAVLASTGEDTTAEVITAARDVCATADLTAAPCVARSATIQTDNNLISAGETLVLDFAGTLTGLANLVITIRYRTRRA